MVPDFFCSIVPIDLILKFTDLHHDPCNQKVQQESCLERSKVINVYFLARIFYEEFFTGWIFLVRIFLFDEDEFLLILKFARLWCR